MAVPPSLSIHRATRWPKSQPVWDKLAQCVALTSSEIARLAADFRRAGLTTTATGARLKYRSVKSPTLYRLLDDGLWPDELKEYRNRLRPNASAPLWLIITEDGKMEQVSGLAQWKLTVLPRLEALVR